MATRAVRRIPIEKRWGEDSLKWVIRFPWNRYKDALDADGDLPEGVPARDVPEGQKASGPQIIIETKEKAPRDFYIKTEDAD